MSLNHFFLSRIYVLFKLFSTDVIQGCSISYLLTGETLNLFLITIACDNYPLIKCETIAFFYKTVSKTCTKLMCSYNVRLGLKQGNILYHSDPL